MKKIILFLFTLVICFSVFCGLNVKATGISLTMSNVVGIRTAGTQQGLKFSCSASEDFDGSTEHGFYLAIGNFDKDTFTAAIESNATTIGEKPLVNKNTNGTDKDFAITVIFPEDASVNDLCTYITSIAYYKNGEDFVFSDINLTKNVADEARRIYNENASPAAIISSTAEATRIKLTRAGVNSYYADFADFSLEANDTIELLRGTYSDSLAINVNNVHVFGPNKDNHNYESRTGEADFTTNGILIGANVSGLEINGIKVSGAAVIQGAPAGNISNLTISNNNFIDITKSRNGLAGPLYFSTSGAKDSNFIITYNNFRNDSVSGNISWNSNYASTRAETAIYVQDVENFEFSHNDVYNFFNGIEVNSEGVIGTGLSGAVNINNNVFYNYVQLALQIKKYNVSTFNICDNTFNDLNNDGSDTAGAIRLYGEGSNASQVVNVIGNSFIDAWGWHMVRVTFNPSKSTVNVKYNLFQTAKGSSDSILVIQNSGDASDINAGYNCYLVADGSAVSDVMLAKLGSFTSVGDNYSTKAELDAGYDAYLHN